MVKKVFLILLIMTLTFVLFSQFTVVQAEINHDIDDKIKDRIKDNGGIKRKDGEDSTTEETSPEKKGPTTTSGIISGADDFVNSGKQDYENAINTQVLSDTVGLIYNTLLIVGTCAAVIVATVLGIQFITGSVEQKVKVKESIIPFIVGCVVLFGAFGIWRLVIILIR